MATTLDSAATEQLDEILEFVTYRLQLSQTQFQNAQNKYRAIGEWLNADDSPVRAFDPRMYPQGSLAQDTTVKPFGRSHFDLDVICELKVPDFLRDVPQVVYDLIWDRLASNGRYRDIISREKRCIRINYADSDQFHLDVVPAISAPHMGEDHILVTDVPRDGEKNWKPSNPKGFTEWLNSRATRIVKFADRRFEPLRPLLPADRKPVLKLTIQLLKRWRDIEFDGASELLPPSIVLTTIAGQRYSDQESCAEALTDLLDQLVFGLPAEPPIIRNPANAYETITEKWLGNREAYLEFRRRVGEFRKRWQTLLSADDFPATVAELKRLFGEPVTAAVEKAAERMGRARDGRTLGVTRDRLTLTAQATSAAAAVGRPIGVARNTFFGARQ